MMLPFKGYLSHHYFSNDIDIDISNASFKVLGLLVTCIQYLAWF